MSNTTKILGIIVIIGFVFVFSSLLIFRLFPTHTFEGVYSIINWVLPALTAILIAILLFTSKGFQEIWAGESIVKKIFSTLGSIILIALTAVVSWFVVTYIGFANGSYSSSTYGTPIYRPKVR